MLRRPTVSRRPHLRRVFLLSCAALVVGCGDDGFQRFEGVAGPDPLSVTWPETPTSWRRFRGGDASRMAVLLTDTASAWLGMVHTLRTAGVPFLLTTDAGEAVGHRVVVAYPDVGTDAAAQARLRAHVRGGGTLVAFGAPGGLGDVLGVAPAIAPATEALTWEEDALRGVGFAEPELRTTWLAPPGDRTRVEGDGYTGTATVLVRWGDGTAAVTASRAGGGEAYAVGIDVGALALRTSATDASAAAAGGYAPRLDVFARLLRDIYRAGEPDAVTLHTVPGGRSLAVVLTHDVDGAAWEPALALAREEKDAGVASTWFVRTKFRGDLRGPPTFTDSTRPYLRALDSLGMELASHSVSHSPVFARFPLGTGGERYPGYRPPSDSTEPGKGSLFGELRVSKFLLERVGGADSVVSYRPGPGATPPELPQALVATGYHYASSATTVAAGTHLPFRMTWGRGTKTELPAWDFPVTVDGATSRDDALLLARALRRSGGLYLARIRPETPAAVELQRAIVAETKPYAWMGTLAQYGGWWAVRDGVTWDVRREGTWRRVRLVADGRVTGLALRVPAGWRALTKMERGPEGWIVPDFLGEVTVVFDAGA